MIDCVIRSWALLNANAATGEFARLWPGCQLSLVGCSDVVQRVLFSGHRNYVAAACVGGFLLDPLPEALT